MQKKSSGFTLIELLVVATIIAVMMAVGVVSYSSASKKSRDTKRQNDIEQIRSALEMYRADNGYYPADGSGSWTTSMAGLSSYIANIPTDPKGISYRYMATSLSGGNYYGYNLVAQIESTGSVTSTCTVPPAADTGGVLYTYCQRNP